MSYERYELKPEVRAFVRAVEDLRTLSALDEHFTEDELEVIAVETQNLGHSLYPSLRP